jgi:hypothetical protein
MPRQPTADDRPVSLEGAAGAATPRAARRLPDVVVGLLLATLAAGGSFTASGPLVEPLFAFSLDNFWFDADVPRVIRQMTDPLARQPQTGVHPVFPLVAFGSTQLIQQPLGLAVEEAVRAATAAQAALVIVALFALLRLLGCGVGDGALFSLVGTASAWAVFWSVVPESRLLSAASLLGALVVAARAARRAVHPAWITLASAATLAILVTNWATGIAATLASLPWRRAIQVTVNAFCLVVVLVGVQRAVQPYARVFFEDPLEIVHGQRVWVADPRARGPRPILRALFVHSVAMPRIHEARFGRFPGLSVQRARTGSGGPLGRAAVTLWLGLLALGLWGLAAGAAPPAARAVLGLAVALQVGLHLLYGRETFLYAAHLGPLLTAVAALSSQTPARRVARLAAAALIVCAAVNNGAQYARAVALLRATVAVVSPPDAPP